MARLPEGTARYPQTSPSPLGSYRLSMIPIRRSAARRQRKRGVSQRRAWRRPTGAGWRAATGEPWQTRSSKGGKSRPLRHIFALNCVCQAQGGSDDHLIPLANSLWQSHRLGSDVRTRGKTVDWGRHTFLGPLSHNWPAVSSIVGLDGIGPTVWRKPAG